MKHSSLHKASREVCSQRTLGFTSDSRRSQGKWPIAALRGRQRAEGRQPPACVLGAGYRTSLFHSSQPKKRWEIRMQSESQREGDEQGVRGEFILRKAPIQGNVWHEGSIQYMLVSLLLTASQEPAWSLCQRPGSWRAGCAGLCSGKEGPEGGCLLPALCRPSPAPRAWLAEREQLPGT